MRLVEDDIFNANSSGTALFCKNEFHADASNNGSNVFNLNQYLSIMLVLTHDCNFPQNLFSLVLWLHCYWIYCRALHSFFTFTHIPFWILLVLGISLVLVHMLVTIIILIYFDSYLRFLVLSLCYYWLSYCTTVASKQITSQLS